MSNLNELIDTYLEQENIHRFEGRQGVENLCRLARALGYRDPTYFGQLTSKASIGDLVCMLEDNSGMIEAMIDWIRDSNSQEFAESLTALVKVEDAAVDQYEGGICPDCGEEINPTAVKGDECDNCGHVFTWGDVD